MKRVDKARGRSEWSLRRAGERGCERGLRCPVAARSDFPTETRTYVRIGRHSVGRICYNFGHAISPGSIFRSRPSSGYAERVVQTSAVPDECSCESLCICLPATDGPAPLNSERLCTSSLARVLPRAASELNPDPISMTADSGPAKVR